MLLTFGNPAHYSHRLASSATVLVALLIAACASTPQPVERQPAAALVPSLGDEIAVRAIAQVGKPYVYGGADLHGFDCSGLVYYILQQLGIAVPRTAAEQYKASIPVNIHHLRAGDLLFFRTTSRHRVTHVGIYAGEGRFVHAPQSGRTIELSELSDAYYAPRLVGAGRLEPSGT